jgi:hypothetical protein
VTDRPTKSHEYVFLLTKAERYFYDADAIVEPAAYDGRNQVDLKVANAKYAGGNYGQAPQGFYREVRPRWKEDNNGQKVRNARTVWTIPTQPFPEAHFATFPQKLVEPCVKTGTSEWGCCATCGAPYERILQVNDPESRLGKVYHDHVEDLQRGQRGVFPAEGAPTRKTTGWRKPCTHRADVAKCVVLDPFAGAGTTGYTAQRLGRKAVLIELSESYCEMMKKRMAQGVLL